MKVSCAQQADPRPSVLAGVTCAGRALEPSRPRAPSGTAAFRPLVAGAQAEDLPLGGPGRRGVGLSGPASSARCPPAST
ncbi:hypothetical protein EVA_08798 [gut metagenome]|uniref:Uncharacterized protein n=1 Tax=gut metagenome TaxID=749906 RepID=J9GSB9_9ZZZZ